MTKVTYFEALKEASLVMKENKLDPTAANFFMQKLAGFDQTNLLIHYGDVVPYGLQQQFNSAVADYLLGVSPQYIIGYADFYGYRFSVNPSVLIPRQETEEMVEWLLKDYKDQSRTTVLDVGTGSGAIGLTLKKERPTWVISISDISSDALEIARKNAVILNVEVTIRIGNLLSPFTGSNFDVVVMNPPYIDRDKTQFMDQNVIKSEPSLALFADNHGLAIYELLAQQLLQGVITTDRLYLEIGFDQGNVVKELFQTTFPNTKVKLLQDIAGHDRMIRVIFNHRNGE